MSVAVGYEGTATLEVAEGRVETDVVFFVEGDYKFAVAHPGDGWELLTAGSAVLRLRDGRRVPVEVVFDDGFMAVLRPAPTGGS